MATVPNVQIGIPKADRSGWSPWLHYQAPFMRSPKKICVLREGRGTGKTAQLAAKATAVSFQYDKLRSLWITPESGLFDEGILPKFQAMDETFENLYGFPLIAGVKNSNGRQTIRLFNDSLFVFKSAKNIQSVRGGEYGQLICDEGAKVSASAEAWSTMAPTLRGYGPQRILVGGTPEGYAGLLGLMLDQERQGDPDVAVFTATSLDNPYQDQKNLAMMKRTMSERMWKREILGEVDIGVLGQVYTTYKPDIHIRREPFPIRKLLRENQWKYVVALDWGTGQSCALWCAIRYYKNTSMPEIVVFHQMDFTQTPSFSMVQQVIRWNEQNLDGKRPECMVVDPEGFTTDLRNRCYALEYADWVREKDSAKRSVVGTLELVQRALGGEGEPVLLTLSREYAELPLNQEGGKGLCQGFVHYCYGNKVGELGNEPHDDNKVAHALDDIRYVLMNTRRIGSGYEFENVHYEPVYQYGGG